MRLSTRMLCSLLALSSLATPVAWAAAGGAWEQIDASEPFEDRTGVLRTPSCSGGPVVQGGEVVPGDTAFSFFMRAGDPKRLLVFFDGGGACWDDNTCIGAPLAGEPLYAPAVDETPTALTAGLGGLLDNDNADNPVRDFTQVFIPYCTGDLHFGAKEASYTAPDGGHWVVHHRGHDNVVAVLDYLADYFDTQIGQPPTEIVLVGVSAGGYGVLYNYPVVAERFPFASKIRVLADSSNGVITEDLASRALAEDGVWGAWDNLVPELETAFTVDAQRMIPQLFMELGWNYPQTRFGQYTRAFDEVQIMFYNVARNVNSPELWLDPAQLLIAGLEWTAKARAGMWMTALTTRNYRFYLARGSDHVILPYEGFYTEASAGDVKFSAWFKDMLDRERRFGGNWRNLSCAPDCLPLDGFQF